MNEINQLGEKRGIKYIINNVLLAFSFPLVLYVCYYSPLYSYLQQDFIQKFLHQLLEKYQYGHIWLPLVYTLFAGLIISIGMPRTAMSFVSATIFGFWIGILLSEIASILGASITFCYIRWIKSAWIKNKKYTAPAWYEYVEKHAFLSILVMRQLPLPGLLFNILLGASKVPLRTFCLASAIGFFPQNLIFSLYGAGFKESFYVNTIFASVLLVVFTFLTYFLCLKVSFVKNLWQRIHTKGARAC